MSVSSVRLATHVVRVRLHLKTSSISRRDVKCSLVSGSSLVHLWATWFCHWAQGRSIINYNKPTWAYVQACFQFLVVHDQVGVDRESSSDGNFQNKRQLILAKLLSMTMSIIHDQCNVFSREITCVLTALTPYYFILHYILYFNHTYKPRPLFWRQSVPHPVMWQLWKYRFRCNSRDSSVPLTGERLRSAGSDNLFTCTTWLRSSHTGL